ncbi:hypothetical protein DTO013E5_3844 [Penicillium roqueforti]|uniref:uncharacterized protein n=1 Tax=Penicillium roqueforti TaxID=5082 RepID=UPI00190B18CE|nr:uncharacterized protein LCP9604111_1725 [Penicillium roqueforti]KAF9251729.1 hypothetical protein LCP9604111_1725 [Penicillium roqueforti]KAI1836457.1 hypothetical protein CBS147337_2684 [Penicillium roqueforti]KAI2685405.1 hypothetical protein LCP963914a_4732 [Penicillium roqueforti]KAI2690233.1 hypothetical protein CBS147355_684 [Penicillium roqueforti]KAI2695200.1 hypothetical protein CBS147372_9328 [Penicillium roqueforti]
MTSLFTDVAESAIGLRRMSQSGAVVPARPSLLQGLPAGYAVRVFSQLERLQADAGRILQLLQENKDGNQWLVVLGLSTSTIRKLDDDHSSLGGVEYRFQWEGSTGVIKVVPSHTHDMTTDQVTRSIDDRLSAMRIRSTNRKWAATSTYKPTPTKGKQGDQAFIPPSRCPSPQRPAGWPTFVIETGVSESLPRLREDAKWWLAASSGDVRIVLVISIKRTSVYFEKWQLAPSNAPRPLTRAYIDTLRLQGPHIPPLFQQPATIQQAYSAHEVEVTPTGIEGTPMILPFAALYDRDPGRGEVDVVLDPQDFRDITSILF